jgi:hypothetical protein
MSRRSTPDQRGVGAGSTTVAIMVPATVTRPEILTSVLFLIARQATTKTVDRSVTTTRPPTVNRITGQMPATALTFPKIGWLGAGGWFGAGGEFGADGLLGAGNPAGGSGRIADAPVWVSVTDGPVGVPLSSSSLHDTAAAIARRTNRREIDLPIRVAG